MISAVLKKYILTFLLVSVLVSMLAEGPQLSCMTDISSATSHSAMRERNRRQYPPSLYRDSPYKIFLKYYQHAELTLSRAAHSRERKHLKCSNLREMMIFNRSIQNR